MDTYQGLLAHWLSLARHTPLGVICDLDGTLLPFVSTPSESRLPPELAEQLSELAALPGLSLAIVSGRPREDLERLLAPVPGVWLVAEHGGWRRSAGAWEATVDRQPEDVEPLATRLRQISRFGPGRPGRAQDMVRDLSLPAGSGAVSERLCWWRSMRRWRSSWPRRRASSGSTGSRCSRCGRRICARA